MNIKRIAYIIFFLVGVIFQCFPQDKFYFDRSGIAVSEEQAYYYRDNFTPGKKVTSYYRSSNSIFFNGEITFSDNKDERNNKYHDTCRWYHKNGKVKAEIVFNAEGKENGLAKYYHESGRILKELEYQNGKRKNNFVLEYDEDGTAYKIVEEEFNDNRNDWELYTSDKSEAKIENSTLLLSSFTKNGTSRYVSMEIPDAPMIIEAKFKPEPSDATGRCGLIYDFKDWKNHSFFLYSGQYFYAGIVFEGITSYFAEGMFASALSETDYNTLKVVAGENNLTYVINGDVVYKTERRKRTGSQIGFAVSGKMSMKVDRLEIKIVNDKMSGKVELKPEDKNVRCTGSGLLISDNGYFITNHHVVERGEKIFVELHQGNKSVDLPVKVIAKDETNDLAILKVTDSSFRSSERLQLKFRPDGPIDLGSSVFTIGFPMALNGMGKDPKFTDGKISSKTGYNGELNAFQTTIPVQPGNSGGPVFNEKGELTGLINSKIFNADNVSYAIKLNYMKALLETLPDYKYTEGEDISSLSLEEKIKRLLNMVVLIKVKE